MSFTVTRYKDGKPTPIRLSIWDAFKGAPTPRRRPAKPCSCCNKIHPKKPRKANADASTTAANTKTQSREKDDADKTTRSTKNTETYSKEDDAKIIEMKAAQKSWKEILAAINKDSLSQVKEHWRMIDPSRNQNSSTSSNSTGKGGKELNDAKKAEIERKKAEGQAKKQREKEEQDQKDKHDTSGVTTDSLKSLASASNDLKTFVDRYDRHKWMAAASKHFELTGERITAAAARKMAEEKG